jgi:hypothetical protein
VIEAAATVRVLEDAAHRAPAITESLDASARALIERGGGTLTSGNPRFTWNGLDEAGRLFPGVHPATAGEAQLRFAFNDHRARMFERMRSSLAHIREQHPDVRYVLGGGSFFSGKEHPGDIDLVLLAKEPDMVEVRRLNRLNPTVHVYPASPSFAGIPQRSFVDFMRHDRNDAERGLVLLDLDELLAPAAR